MSRDYRKMVTLALVLSAGCGDKGKQGGGDEDKAAPSMAAPLTKAPSQPPDRPAALPCPDDGGTALLAANFDREGIDDSECTPLFISEPALYIMGSAPSNEEDDEADLELLVTGPLSKPVVRWKQEAEHDPMQACSGMRAADLDGDGRDELWQECEEDRAEQVAYLAARRFDGTALVPLEGITIAFSNSGDVENDEDAVDCAATVELIENDTALGHAALALTTEQTGSHPSCPAPGRSKVIARGDKLVTVETSGTAASQGHTTVCGIEATKVVKVRADARYVITAQDKRHVVLGQDDACQAFEIGRADARVTGKLGQRDAKHKAFVIGRCKEGPSIDGEDGDAICHGAIVVRDMDKNILDIRPAEYTPSWPMELEVVKLGSRRFVAHRTWHDHFHHIGLAFERVHLYEFADNQLHASGSYWGSVAFQIHSDEDEAEQARRALGCQDGEFVVEVIEPTIELEKSRGALAFRVARKPGAEEMMKADEPVQFVASKGFVDRLSYDKKTRTFSQKTTPLGSPPTRRTKRCVDMGSREIE